MHLQTPAPRQRTGVLSTYVCKREHFFESGFYLWKAISNLFRFGGRNFAIFRRRSSLIGNRKQCRLCFNWKGPIGHKTDHFENPGHGSVEIEQIHKQRRNFRTHYKDGLHPSVEFVQRDRSMEEASHRETQFGRIIPVKTFHQYLPGRFRSITGFFPKRQLEDLLSRSPVKPLRRRSGSLRAFASAKYKAVPRSVSPHSKAAVRGLTAALQRVTPPGGRGRRSSAPGRPRGGGRPR